MKDKEYKDAFTEGYDDIPKKKPKRKRGILFYLIFLVLLSGALFCFYKVYDYYHGKMVYEKQLDELIEEVGDISERNPEIRAREDAYTEVEGYTEPVYTEWMRKYDELHNENADCYGWIKIPDTNIDYPVMYTPNDPQKYIHKGFDTKYQYRGLPFLSAETVIGHDNNMYRQSSNYIIYAHNMLDGTGFRDLLYYLKEDYGKEHRYAYFNIEYEEGIYELMAVVKARVYHSETKEFEYYNYSGILDIKQYEEYVETVKERSVYDTGVTASWGDKLLTLSTCHRRTGKDDRLIVIFKKVG